AKRHTLPRYCRECEVRAMCNGGCPKDRIIQTPDSEPGLNYLCAGYKRFFTYCRPYVTQLAALRRAGQPPERLMQLIQAAEMKARPKTGRKHQCPCPCVVVRKYNHACLRLCAANHRTARLPVTFLLTRQPCSGTVHLTGHA